jgi:hypothetical protein
LCGLPRLEEPLFAREDVSALARLEVEQQPLELVGSRQDRLRVARQALRPAQVGDREQQDRERRGDDASARRPRRPAIGAHEQAMTPRRGADETPGTLTRRR